MTAPAHLRRIEFTTPDQAEAREFIEQAYGGRLKLRPSRGTSWRVSLSKADAEDFSTAEVTLPASLTFKLTGRDRVIINTLLGGTVAHDQGKASRRYRPGDVYYASYPGPDITSRTHDVRTHTVSLSASLLAEVAAAETASGPPRFLSPRPLDGAARRWRETTRFVSSLLADPEVATAPLLIAAAGRLLAATVLTTFPNTAVTEPTAEDRNDAHSRTVRRAVSFIESNADREITVGDIAVAARVTPRALQLAFRRHRDTTPMAYLRRVRLDQARQELDRARRDQGTTVSAVAYRWGFPSPSRFAEQYRAAYGELPSATLLR
jgi:AraC-like DNA-binding protein